MGLWGGGWRESPHVAEALTLEDSLHNFCFIPHASVLFLAFFTIDELVYCPLQYGTPVCLFGRGECTWNL